ncbi:hydrolase [Virgisporangium aliadipatigenens]|uniref:Hydrolase n=1 Tax=Virgisporangium aliadipatigenens TaxID=741659 RepID=A0A8J3YL41_9ACTN|nr:HAD family hydrolase [Virgisporangium aliadipatigenens]GIJ47161.1 hydrolase [Virgisporangium aliadipatigenens]
MSRLASIVKRARVLLLDFDGPVCSVFAGYPADTIAAELRRALVDQGMSLPAELLDEPDPLEVLRYSATLNRPGVMRKVDEVFRAAEVAAVRSASPTPFAREAIVTAHQTGRRVAIVSNNSGEAVREYLVERRLTRCVFSVVGRPADDPAKMKPDPVVLLVAMKSLGAQESDCLMIGDSVSDIQAARAAGVPVVGYANKPGKDARLAEADAVVSSMAEIAEELSEAEL